MNISIYNELLILIWLTFSGYWAIAAMGVKKGGTNWWQWWTIRILMIIAIVALLRTPLFDRLDGTPMAVTSDPIVGSIGVILAAVGIAFAIWARKNLGRNWGMPMTIKEEPELVTSGPYQYVRHPIYTGVLIAMLGSILIAGLPWGVMLIIFGAYFIYSALQEEKVMMRTFPNQYPAYKARTKMLIPFIF